MKKTIILLLILFITPVFVSAEQQVEDMYENVLNINQHFFESSVVPIVDVEENKKKNPNIRINEDSFYTEFEEGLDNGASVSNEEKYVNHMPYFKKIRLKLTRVYRTKVEEHDKAVAEKQALKEKAKEANEELIEDTTIKETKSEDTANLKSSNSEVTSPQPEAFKTGIKSQVTQTEMQLDCDEVKVNEETGELEALGRPVIYIPEDNIKLIADKMVYNNESNILKAIDNVVLIKNGTPIYGDYLQVNMNEENILMDNVKTSAMTILFNAKKAENENGITTAYDGRIYSPKSHVFRLRSNFIGPDFEQILVDEAQKSALLTKDNSKIRIDASEIYVDAGKYHEYYRIKDAEVFRNNKYLFTMPHFSAYTNKEHTYFESNYPEFGTMSQMGMFVGPGLVTKGPYGSIIKWLPLLNYDSGKFGFGGAAKFHSTFNNTQIMYGSSNNKFIISGRQHLDDKLYLDYVSNAYMDNWFLGGRMPTYAAELTYNDKHVIKNMLAKGLNLTYAQRASIAIAQDGTYNTAREKITGSKIITPRFRYMAQATQNLYSYVNRAERKVFNISLIMQGSAAVYGTGDTQIIGRIAPSIHTQYKNWMQDISYFISGYSDDTPMPVFDSYRYGHSNLYIREALRLHKYLSVGWAGSISLLKDSPNGEMFQENAFILAIGPDDCKFSIGYDFMRERTYFSFSTAFDTKNVVVDYDKLVIKDIENLGKTNSNDSDLSFQQEKPSNVAKPKVYAQVINIEDPDKESI